MTANFTPVDDGNDIYHPEWVAFEQALGSRPALTGDLDIDRPAFDQMGRDLKQQWPSLDSHLNITEETDPVPMRIYTPRNPSPPPAATILYFHGGGFVSGDLDTEDPHCRILATHTPSVVINVDYPLAPAVSMDDILAAGIQCIDWVQAHPVHSSRPLVLAGGSAGATLALQLACRLRHTDTIKGLVLVEAITTPAALTPYTGPFAEMHQSLKMKEEGAPFLNRRGMQNMIQVTKMDIQNPAHFPLLMDSMSGFPRTYIVTAEHDPARDDGRVLARRLQSEGDAGVKEVCYEGMPHWFQWFPSVPMAGVMMEETAKGVRWVVGLDVDVESKDAK